ncbi:MAG: zf-HC2 domain-containing protein [Nitrospirota bacterium]
MRCSKAHKLISPYIDGELPEREVSELEGHMKVCDKCRAEFEEGNDLHNLFANMAVFKAPYGFHKRLMANISSGKTREISGIPVFVRFAEAFVIIAIIVIGVVSGSFLIQGFIPDKTKEVMASLSLDVFDSAPPDSLGGVYLAMTEERNEE